MKTVPDPHPQTLQQLVHWQRRRQVGLQRRICARFGLFEKRCQDLFGLPVSQFPVDGEVRPRKRGSLRRHRPRLPILRDHSPREDFGRLHVRLIERVDRQTPSGRRRGDLPEIALTAQIIGIRQFDVDDGMADFGQCIQLRLSGGLSRQPDRTEDPVRTVNRRRSEFLPDDRQDPLPLFSQALCNELLHPVAEGGKRLGREKGKFVAPARRQISQKRS